MYRTATIAQYDVVDQVFITATIKEYPSTPGTLKPIEYVVSTVVSGRGEDDAYRWLWEGLSALCAEAAAQ